MSFKLLMDQFNVNIRFDVLEALSKHGGKSRPQSRDNLQDIQGGFSLKSLSRAKPPIPVFDKGGLLETSGFSVSPNNLISHREVSKFIQANKDLLYVIDKDETLTKQISKIKISKREDLTNIIAERAFNLLNSNATKKISQNDLKKQSTLSSMIVLNTGGIKDLINKSEDVAGFFSNGSEALDKNIYKKLAEKVAEIFPKAHPLNDKEFFSNNPRAAIFLLGHQDVGRHFILKTNGASQAVEFKNEVNLQAYQDIFESEVNQLAVQLTQLGGFDSDYFTQNSELATFIAASNYIEDAPSAAQWLRQYPEAALNNVVTKDSFNFNSFLTELVSVQKSGIKYKNTNITEDLLKSNFGLARLLDSEPKFKVNLARPNDQRDFDIIFGTRGSSDIKLSSELDMQLKSSFVSSFQDLMAAYKTIA